MKTALRFASSTLWLFNRLALGLLLLAGLATAQVATGTYVGNAVDNRAITGVGFQPAVVFIKGNNNNIDAAIRTASMTGDVTKLIGSGGQFNANVIQSLDADGFTVGTHDRANNTGVTYHWMAFPPSANLKTGSYTGNETGQAITGVGFQPEYVIIIPAESNPVNQRSFSMTATYTFTLDGGNSNKITSLDTDGFTLGSHVSVSNNNDIYHYVAWNAAAGEMLTGSYVGNATDNRNITGSFTGTPGLVIVKNTHGRRALLKPNTLADPSSFPFDDSALVSDGIKALNSGGFQVGDGTDANQDTRTIAWVAFGPLAPTLAQMEKYEAFRADAGNLIRWQSSYEKQNLGFRVLRRRQDAKANRLEEVTPNLIAGSAFLSGDAALTAGNAYSWTDRGGAPGDTYFIEDVDLNGTTTRHGPVTVRDEGAGLREEVKSSPLLNELRPGAGVREKQVLPLELRPAATIPQAQNPQTAVRIPQLIVRRDGWYRVNGAELLANGLPSDADARFLQLYAGNRQVPLAVRTATGRDSSPLGETGRIEFYGVGLDTRETDANVYQLIVGDTPGLRIGPPVRGTPGGGGDVEGGSGILHFASGIPNQEIPNAKSQTPERPSTTRNLSSSFPYTIEHRERTFYFATLRNGDAENFFGPLVASAEAHQTLRITHLDATASSPARLSVALQGATAGAHQVTVALNGQQLGVVSFDGQEHRVTNFNVPVSLLQAGDNTVTLRALNGSSDVSLGDYLRLTYPHLYAADDNQLLFSTGQRNGLTVSGFTTPNVRVFDLTVAGRYFEVASRLQPDGNTYAVNILGTLNRRLLLAVADNRVLAPASVVAYEPSDWANPAHAYDFLIITPRAFRDAAQPLADARRAQRLRTAVVALEDVFGDWNGGVKDTAALRAFLRYAHDNWQAGPRYVLLLGDASTDPRNYLGPDESDLLPTAYVATPYLETASDESLADFDGDGIGEMSFGRLPARTLAQAQEMVARTLAFTPHDGGALFVADRPQGYDFAAVNQATREALPADMPATFITRDSQPDNITRSQIVAGLNQGPSLLQYAGHGSVQVWAGAPLFDLSDALSATNGQRRPLVLSLTCFNGYFQDPFTDSLAEGLLRAPHGGAIAVLASSGLTPASSQAPVGRAFVQAVYGNAGVRLGDAARQAKGATPDLHLRRTWILFGDPTLAMR